MHAYSSLKRKHLLLLLISCASFLCSTGCCPTPPMAETLHDNLMASLGMNYYYTENPNVAIRWNQGFLGSTGSTERTHRGKAVPYKEPGQWKDLGFTPGESLLWSAHFTPGHAYLWKQAGFGPDEAAAWETAGFRLRDLSAIQYWKKEGFTPQQARALHLAGMNPTETVLFRDMGYR